MEAKENRRRPTYPRETRSWAVALVRRGQHRQKDVARHVGCTARQLRRWMRQADIDDGERRGMTTNERRELWLLRRANQRLQERIQLMEEAQDFFASETR